MRRAVIDRHGAFLMVVLSLAFVTSSCTVPERARASRWVSASHGSDHNPGTRKRPWRTLTHAGRRVRPGQTVYLRSGRYSRPGWTVRLRRSGRPGRPIVFASAPGEHAVIRGLISVEGDYVNLSRLMLVGRTGPVADPSSDNPEREQVKVYVTGDHGVIAHCRISGSRWHAGLYLDKAYDVQIRHNTVTGNGLAVHGKLDQGIYWSSGSGQITANVVSGNAAYGIQLYPRPDGVVVSRNLVTGNGAGGIIAAEDATNIQLVANTVTGNAGPALLNLLSGGRQPGLQGNVFRDGPSGM